MVDDGVLVGHGLVELSVQVDLIRDTYSMVSVTLVIQILTMRALRIDRVIHAIPVQGVRHEHCDLRLPRSRSCRYCNQPQGIDE